MESFWKAKNKYRRKKRGGGANIEAEKLIEHYSKLLGGGENREGNKEAMGNANININQITTNKLNEDLTKAEINREIKRLKNGKAAWEDGVTAEFLKNLPDCWEQELLKIL